MVTIATWEKMLTLDIVASLHTIKMKEKEIRQKAKEILERNGYHCWWPINTPYGRQDIFTIYDLLAVNKRHCLFIQLTTKSHTAERRRKMKDYTAKYNLLLFSELWSWNDKSNTFDVEIV